MNAHAHHLTRDQVVALLEERDTLREEVRQLKEALRPECPLPRRWRLSKTEENLLLAIRAASPNVLHRERGMIALYGMLEDTPDQKALDVHLNHLRKKLRAANAGIVVETVWGRGWRLDVVSARRFDEAVAADRAATPAAWPASVRVA